MKAIVVSSGQITDYDFAKRVLESGDLIVCADGGGVHVERCKLVPDAVVGDLDSIDEELLKKLRDNGVTDIVKYPREKDYTDTQLAIDYAIENGADEIIMMGSVGDRLDHTVANIFLLLKLLKNNIKPCIINEKNTVYITDRYISIKGKIGDLVSLIPVGGDVKGICTKGLKYKLSNATITMGDPLGISNVFTDEVAEIEVNNGFLLVIKSRD